MSMRIGIIGAGKIGSTLAHLFIDAGHDVAIANSRGPDTLRDLEKELGEHGRAGR
jgi:8-hydroxy-5-deazaflavin:NADPH oxidoreductase